MTTLTDKWAPRHVIAKEAEPTTIQRRSSSLGLRRHGGRKRKRQAEKRTVTVKYLTLGRAEMIQRSGKDKVVRARVGHGRRKQKGTANEKG